MAISGNRQGKPIALADTGTLATANDGREAAQVTCSIGNWLSAETLHAATISYPTEVDSEASVTNLNVTVNGVTVVVDVAMARASKVLGAAGTGSATFSNVSINGSPVSITGSANQAVAVPGGQLILNEQNVSATGATVVNAIHMKAWPRSSQSTVWRRGNGGLEGRSARGSGGGARGIRRGGREEG